MNTTLIVGDGYIGSAVADALADRQRCDGTDGTIAATSRSSHRTRHRSAAPADSIATRTDRSGVLGILLDVTDPRTFENLRPLLPIDRVLFSVGYRSSGKPNGPNRDDVHVVGLRRLLRWFENHCDTPPHVVSLSTTGVYHQTGGVWVDERSPTHPHREGGRVHLRGERTLINHHPADRQTILRLAGIYGPGRWPNRQSIASGRSVHSDPESFLNLIHRDDIVAAVIAAMRHRVTGLFCVADDHPVRRRDYYNAVAQSVGLPSATFADVIDPSKRRSASNKRVDNRSMKRRLLRQLSHPSSLPVITNLP